VLVFTRGDHPAVRLTITNDGHYGIVLPADTYTVAVSPQPSVGRGLEPSTVRVVAGRNRRVDFQVDTGIR
jgi:hypothetical protein